jgi:hypothetical protein
MFIDLLQKVTTDNYKNLELHIVKINVTTAHSISACCVLASVLVTASNGDIPLLMDSRTSPVVSATATL